MWFAYVYIIDHRDVWLGLGLGLGLGSGLGYVWLGYEDSVRVSSV